MCHTQIGSYRFDRKELAGSLGDLGNLLPFALGLILVNRLDPTSVFTTVGLFYILAGVYFRNPMPVQPMKVVAAYSIAKGLTQKEIMASALWMSAFLLFVGATGLIEPIGKRTPKSVVRGIQLSVGVVLLLRGLQFILQRDPNLPGALFGFDIGLLLGIAGFGVVLLLSKSERVPAALILVFGGLLVGLLGGRPLDRGMLTFGINLPRLLPYGLPAPSDFALAAVVLAIPQIPTTVGNAIISVSDLSRSYFGEGGKRASFRGLSLSQGAANLCAFAFGCVPLCHGAGGLAAHYKFGARTPGANVIIGAICMGLGIVLGPSLVQILQLLPLSILGVLLAFSGAQLVLMIKDIKRGADLFIALLILALSITTNLGFAFVCGVAAAWVLGPKNLTGGTPHTPNRGQA